MGYGWKRLNISAQRKLNDIRKRELREGGMFPFQAAINQTRLPLVWEQRQEPVPPRDRAAKQQAPCDEVG